MDDLLNFIEKAQDAWSEYVNAKRLLQESKINIRSKLDSLLSPDDVTSIIGLEFLRAEVLRLKAIQYTEDANIEMLKVKGELK